MIFWLPTGFLVVLDLFFSFLLYRDQIINQRVYSSFPAWRYTKKPIAYIVSLIVLIFLNIPAFTILYFEYGDTTDKVLISFYLSLVYLLFVMLIEMIFIGINKLVSGKAINKNPIASTESIQDGEFLIDEVVNCGFPDGKRKLARFKMDKTEITLWSEGLYSEILRILFFWQRTPRNEKTKLTSINLSDINRIEKTKFLLSKNAFHIVLFNGDGYRFILQQPQDALIKLRSVLPNVLFINFNE